jgi:hypothetical protein
VSFASLISGREAARGETEGRKHRPVAVGVRISRPRREDVLILFPITSQPPASDRFAVEIPEMESVAAALMPPFAFGLSSTNTIRTLLANHSIWNRSRHLGGSARHSFYH